MSRCKLTSSRSLGLIRSPSGTVAATAAVTLLCVAIATAPLNTAAAPPSEIVLGGKRFPGRVQLDEQFKIPKPTQVGGMCHIYAAVNLVEAACFRKIRKHVDISEAYLVNKHLSVQFAQMVSFPLKAELKQDYLSGLPEFDEGQPEDALRALVKDREACTEDELPLAKSNLADVKKFIQSDKKRHEELLCIIQKAPAKLDPSAPNPKDETAAISRLKWLIQNEQAIIQETQKWKAQHPIASKILLSQKNDLEAQAAAAQKRKRAFEDEIRLIEQRAYKQLPKLVLSKLQNGNVRGSLAQFTTLPETQATAQASNAGENSTLAPQRPVTSNPDLRNCLDSGLSIEKAQFSNQLAMELLSKGTPFICQGYFRFPNGLQGWHASTVIGYEYAETNHGGLRYRLMDSYWQRPVTIDELNCETVLVINVGA